MNKNLSKIVILFSLFCFSCQKINLYYQKKMMSNNMLDNRRALYNESFGQIDDPELDLE